MTSEFEISRATGKCAQTGRPFAEGQMYYAVLFERPEGLVRMDYSEEAWTGPPEGTFCYWKARVPVRERKPTTIAVDSSVLVNLLNRLEDEPSEMKQQFRFVLALLLMRKRLLRFEKAVRDGEQEFWQMRLVADQSLHQVLNPQLTPEHVERLNAQLIAILSGDARAIHSLEDDSAAPPADEVEAVPEGESAGEAVDAPAEPTADESTAEAAVAGVSEPCTQVRGSSAEREEPDETR